MQKSANVFTSAVPYYYFLKILGLFPSSFMGNVRNERFKRTIFDKIYAFLINCIITTVSAYRLLNPEKYHENASSILIGAWNCTSNFGCTVISIAMVYQYFRIERILDFMKELNSFDEKVNEDLLNIY